MEKPISLTIEEYKATIAKITNESKLPIFVLDSIFRDLYNEVHIGYMQQIEKDKDAWEKSQQEEG